MIQRPVSYFQMGYNEETLDEANVWWHSNQTNRLSLRVLDSIPLARVQHCVRVEAGDRRQLAPGETRPDAGSIRHCRCRGGTQQSDRGSVSGEGWVPVPGVG